MCFFVANFYGIKSLRNWSRNSNNCHPRRWTHWRWQNCHQHRNLLRLDWQRKWRPAFKQLQSKWPFLKFYKFCNFGLKQHDDDRRHLRNRSSRPASPCRPRCHLREWKSCQIFWTPIWREIPSKRIRIRWQLDFTPQWRAEDHIIKVANVSAYITGVLKTYPLI